MLQEACIKMHAGEGRRAHMEPVLMCQYTHDLQQCIFCSQASISY